MTRRRGPGGGLAVGMAIVAVLAAAYLLCRNGETPPPGPVDPRSAPAPAAGPPAGPSAEGRHRVAGAAEIDRKPEAEARAWELVGVVLDDDALPVYGAQVWIEFGVRHCWNEHLASTTTDAVGAFRVDARRLLAVSPMQKRDLGIHVAASAQGFHAGGARLSLEEIDEPVELRLHRFDPEALVLWGEVRDRFGEPVQDALICASDPQSEEYVLTDERGSYAVSLEGELVGGPPRTLFAFHAGHGVSLPVEIFLPARGRLRLDFSLTEAEAQVEVVALGLDRRPLPGVRFLIQLEEEGRSPPGPRYRTHATLERRTDEEGRLRLRGFPPGRYRVRWSHAGEGSSFLADVGTVERTVATELMPVEIVIPAVPVDFELVDGDGRPLRDVLVEGTVQPPAGGGEGPAEFGLTHPHRLWLASGSHGSWRASAGGVTRSGQLVASPGRVVVRAAFEPR